MSRRFKTTGMALVLVALTGCATLSPDGDLGALQQLTQGKTAGIDAALAANPHAIADLLTQPLSAEAAVRLALLNNPQLQTSLATLGVSDADRVQMGRLPNPHFAIGRFTEGDTREIERMLRFNVLGLLALPWRAQWQGQQHEIAKLQAAQDVVRLAADTRKAWITAVAAQQSALYLRDVKEAAEAGAELARRMARVGNWSRLEQAREQVLLAEATTQLARAQNVAFSTREKLTRLMGLWGTQTNLTLLDRLPNIPKTATEMTDIEAQALRERLDVRAAVARTGYIARQEGFDKVAGYFDGLALGDTRNTTFNNVSGSQSVKRGWERELPLPLFGWGGAMLGHRLQWFDMQVQSWIELALNLPVVLWAGAPFFVRGWQSLRNRSPNMWTLISLGTGTGAAFVYSLVATLAPQIFPASFISMGRVAVYFEAAAVIISLTLLGQLLELKARSQTSAAIKSLLGLPPKTARRIADDGSEDDIPLMHVHIGDRLRVRPGEKYRWTARYWTATARWTSPC